MVIAMWTDRMSFERIYVRTDEVGFWIRSCYAARCIANLRWDEMEICQQPENWNDLPIISTMNICFFVRL